MAQTTVYNAESQLIETKFEGIVAFKDVKEIVSKIAQVAKEHNCFLCLSDYRDAELKLTTSEIYNLPKLLSDITALYGLCATAFKRAVVARMGLEDFHFFETVTLNNMQNARLFHDLAEAEKWLLEK